MLTSLELIPHQESDPHDCRIIKIPCRITTQILSASVLIHIFKLSICTGHTVHSVNERKLKIVDFHSDLIQWAIFLAQLRSTL